MFKRPGKRQSRLVRNFGQLRRFASEYTGGVRGEDIKRLFDRDASQAIEVLMGKGTPSERRPGHLERARRIFLGVSYRLTPARRLLFALSLIATILGLVGFNAGITAEG